MVRTLKQEQWLARPVEKVFEFFSQAENLEAITPPDLQFHILTPLPIEMREGALIDYRIKLGGIPMRWRTLIRAWEPPHRFVDSQLKGPYRLWEHEHSFEEKDGGTLMRDSVRYEVPGWLLEPLIHQFFVGPKIEKIFAHRREIIEKLLEIKK